MKDPDRIWRKILHSVRSRTNAFNRAQQQHVAERLIAFSNSDKLHKEASNDRNVNFGLTAYLNT
jgi:hypothetical protein